MIATKPTGARRHQALIALVAAPVLLFSAACQGEDNTKDDGIASAGDAPTAKDTGSDAPAAGRPAGQDAYYDAMLTYAQCMRKEGLKDYPDPPLDPGPYAYMEDAKAASGTTSADAEKFRKAFDACQPEFDKAAENAPKVDEQKLYEELLAHAQCMRKQGVSKFANPQMQSNGKVLPGGLDPTSGGDDSPAVKSARQVCDAKLSKFGKGRQ